MMSVYAGVNRCVCLDLYVCVSVSLFVYICVCVSLCVYL